ncbi:MAG: hypothetical protein ACXADY_27065 [Candidatus Hodarchaeales archaeon]
MVDSSESCDLERRPIPRVQSTAFTAWRNLRWWGFFAGLMFGFHVFSEYCDE